MPATDDRRPRIRSIICDGAVPADGRRRRLRPHRALRGRGRAARRLITRQREAGTEVLRFPPVMSRARAREVRLSEELPESARLRVRPARQRARDPRRGRPLRYRRRLDHVAVAGRPRADARRLLSGLSDRGEPRPAAGGRPALRRRLPTASATSPRSTRPAAIVPHARICLHRRARRGRRVPRALDGARAGDRRPTRPDLQRRLRPAIRSSAASAR